MTVDTTTLARKLAAVVALATSVAFIPAPAGALDVAPRPSANRGTCSPGSSCDPSEAPTLQDLMHDCAFNHGRPIPNKAGGVNCYHVP